MSTHKLPQVYSLFALGEGDLETLLAVHKAGWDLGIESGKFFYYHAVSDTLHDNLDGQEEVFEKARYIHAGLELDDVDTSEASSSDESEPPLPVRPPRRGDVAKLVKSLSDEELDQLHAIENLGWSLTSENEAFVLSHSDLELRYEGFGDKQAVIRAAALIIENGSEAPGLGNYSATVEGEPLVNTESDQTHPAETDLSSEETATKESDVPVANPPAEEPAPLLEGAMLFAREEPVEACKLNIDVLRTDGGTQPRAGLDEEVVEAYAEAYRNGTALPAVDAFYDGNTYWLADGFHRRAGAKRAEIDMVDVNLHQGTRRDAVLFSVGANATHGLPRTNADKRRAVVTLLNDPDWSQWSDGLIAKAARVTQPFVSKLRRELTQNGFESNGLRRGADNRVIDTSHIGTEEDGSQNPELFETEKPVEAQISPALAMPQGVTRPSEEMLSLLRSKPEGIPTDELLREGFTLEQVQEAQRDWQFGRTTEGICNYIWKSSDVISAINEHGPLTLMQLEDLGCQRYAVITAEQDGLIKRGDGAAFKLAQPGEPESEEMNAGNTTEAVHAPDTGASESQTLAEKVESPAKPQVPTPEPKKAVAIEDLLQGRGMRVTFNWIQALPGKVSVSVNCGDKPTDTALELITSEDARPFPEAVMRMIATQLSKQTVPASAKKASAKASTQTSAKKPSRPAASSAKKSSGTSTKTPARASAKSATKKAAKKPTKSGTKKR